jgi:hypothetical protein
MARTARARRMTTWIMATVIAGATGASAAPVHSPGSAPLERPAILLARPLASPEGWRDVASNVFPDSSGAWITGWTSRGDEPSDALLLRVDREGEVLARRTYGGAGAELLWFVHPDGRGGLLGAGFTSSRGAGGFDGWVFRLDAQGALAWEKTYGGAGDDRFTMMRPTRGGWLLVGQTASRGAGGADAWVVKVDAEANEVAQWTWGDAGIDRAFALHATEDGGCVIAGMAGATHEESDAFVVKLDAAGRPAWTHRERRAGFQVAHDVRPLAGGGLLVTGYGFVSAKQHIDGFALRMTGAGRVLRETSFGGPTYDRANHSEAFDDGSAVVVGYSQRPGATDEDGWWDLVVHVLDPTGRATWTQRFGGQGVEFGRGVGGTADDVWIVGHTSTGREGSSVLLVRLELAQ